MKRMWNKEQLIKLIEEHGGGIDRYIKAISKLESGDGIDWENQLGAHQQFKIDAQMLANIIEGSETIVVDVSEDNKHLEIHLDGDVIAKLDRALLTPLTLTEFKLVGVSPVANKKKFVKKGKNATEQRMIGISNYFRITNDKLNIVRTNHQIDIEGKIQDSQNTFKIHLSFNALSEYTDFSALKTHLGFIAQQHSNSFTIQANGFVKSGDNYLPIYAIEFTSQTGNVNLKYTNDSTFTIDENQITTFNDIYGELQ